MLFHQVYKNRFTDSSGEIRVQSRHTSTPKPCSSTRLRFLERKYFMALPKALYRALLRPLVSIKRSSQPSVVLWPRVHPSAWGQFRYGGQGDGLRLLPLPDDLNCAIQGTRILIPPSPVVDAADLFRCGSCVHLYIVYIFLVWKIVTTCSIIGVGSRPRPLEQ